ESEAVVEARGEEKCEAPLVVPDQPLPEPVVQIEPVAVPKTQALQLPEPTVPAIIPTVVMMHGPAKLASPVPQPVLISAYVELQSIAELSPPSPLPEPLRLMETEDYDPHLPLKIGGVVMPRYTLVPRGSQLRLWLQRAAVAMLVLSPLVIFSDFYMPYVRRVSAWVDRMKLSRVHLEDIQKQTALNRSNPASQGLKKDALAAFRHEWAKLTAPTPKAATGGSAAHPVVFRSSKPDSASANPEKDWPQMLLRNYGVFHGHSAMEGASSFLIEASDGSHWIATSAHLLGASGGVEPPVLPGKLVNDLDHWQAQLPDKPEVFAEVMGGRQLTTVIAADWLAMRLTSSDAVLPVKPLRLRRTLLRPDENVYLVGLPYKDETGATQHVYRGEVTTTNPVNPSQFAFVVQEDVDFSGFRGAPILDAEGDVVGVLTDRWSTILLGTRSELLAQLMEEK
ncbi:MAG: Dipeptidyl aminopeptidase/acylaminoacyl-peptidase-like protein, partial [Verrucomicrobiaceae bacterium]|nr:Dipeptidyl aminopeptidase/acylaminoacyl-peptidase-like protein [Verrucomicrobiaceae bacterium]